MYECITSKIGKYLHALVTQNYLKTNDEKYYSNISKLIEELTEYLISKDIELDDSEFYIVKELLEQNHFFVLEQDVLYRILLQPTRIHQIDALQVLSNHIGMMCTFAHNARKDGKKLVTDETERKTTRMLSEELDEQILKNVNPIKNTFRGSKSVRKKKMNAVDHINDFIKSLIISAKILQKLKLETLEKLGKLWEQHDGFLAGATLYEKFSEK